MRYGISAHTFSGDNIGIDTFNKFDDLKRHEKWTDDSRSHSIDLLTDTRNFVLGPSVCTFYIAVDYIDEVESRSLPQHFRRTAQLPIRVESEDDSMTYFCYGSESDAGEVMKMVKKILGLAPRSISHLEMPTEVIKEIVNRDAVRLKKGRWSHLDANTEVGTLGGNLDKSSFKILFEKNGKIAGARFESNHLQRKIVSVSANGSVSVEGRDATMPMVVDYIQNVVKPILKGK